MTAQNDRLFEIGSTADAAAEIERDLLAPLERGLRQIDKSRHNETSAKKIATVMSERTLLLRDLDKYAFFEDDRRTLRSTHLKDWGFDTLATYLDAGAKVRAYLVSSERARLIQDSGPPLVIGAPVSLDWFRFPQTPPAQMSEFGWLAACEYLADLSRELSDPFGQLFTPIEGEMFAIRWRKDDGIHRCLYEATPAGVP